ncbi:MAG: hypothetical protein RLZZ347_871 [Candidatus Parcubacteria bacterium]|jgi:poly(A) polymerase/tRNA nucleotidyltransferase (CCA-adding enzyme)
MPSSPKTTKLLQFTIPLEVSRVTQTLEKAGFEAFLVGGCVRDLFLERKPRDWDITTNAIPEQIITLFPKTFYENKYGTVGVVDEATSDETVKIVEVTPYRTESTYSDFRRPDEVQWSDKLEDDLRRRDFTVNAIALSIKPAKTAHASGALFECTVVDPYKGQGDIEKKTIRTVGEAKDRFGEDALRIIRAVRLATDLGFAIATETEEGIRLHVKLLEKIAKERIRDEFSKLLMTSNPLIGIELCRRLGILEYIVPELLKAVGVEQNQAHAYHVWEHLLRSLQHAADKGWPLDIRLSALFHDISKPETRRFSHETNQFTFYGHEVVGSRVTRKIMERLRFPKEMTEKVVKLVRWHMFFSDTEQITLSAVRRMVANVSKEHIWDLMNVRICDRIGTGRPKEDPYRLRKYHAMIEEALRDPISVGMLKIDGKKIMEVTRETPSPRIGWILHALLEEVLEDPKKNTEESLVKRALELAKLAPDQLKVLGEAGKDKKEEEDEKLVTELHKKHRV